MLNITRLFHLTAFRAMMLLSALLISHHIHAAPADDFVIEVDVNKGNGFIIPTDSNMTYAYTIDCGRGSTNTDQGTIKRADYTCLYNSDGTRSIRIKDASNNGTGFPLFGRGSHQLNCHGNQDKLKKILQWGTSKWQSMAFAFAGCAALHSDQTIAAPDLSQVSSMGGMFWDASIFNQPIGHWDTSQITDMASTFRETDAFNQPINNWNVSNIKNMTSMFKNAHAFNQPIGSWNVGNVKYMEQMLSGANAFNQPIGNWDISSLTSSSTIDSALNFLRNGGLTATHYDQLLTGWHARNGSNKNIYFSAGNSHYCSNTAKNSKDALTTADNWSISTSATPERKCPLIWTGSSDNLWDNSANWSTLDISTNHDTMIPANRIPTSNDEVVFNGTASAIISNTPAYAKTLTLTKSFSGTIIINNTLTVGSHYHQTGGTIETRDDNTTCTITTGSTTVVAVNNDKLKLTHPKRIYIAPSANGAEPCKPNSDNLNEDSNDSSDSNSGGSTSTWLIALLGGLALLRRRSVRGYKATP